MKYEIVTIEEFGIEGLKATYKVGDSLSYNIGTLWGIYFKDFAARIKGNSYCVNVPHYDEHTLTVNIGYKSEGNKIITLPTRKYAKFSFVGLIVENSENRLQKFIHEAYDALDKENVDFDDSFTLEEYDERFADDSVASVFEIYIPLETKE